MNYRELVAWQKAMDLVVGIYTATKAFPTSEAFGLTSQLRRAAVSVPSNIAEWQGRKSTADFLRHLAIAHGSLCEVETQLLIAERLAYLDQTAVQHIMEHTREVGRLINGLANSLSARSASAT